jgi:peptide/nickel transport system substrate-binding protein
MSEVLAACGGTSTGTTTAKTAAIVDGGVLTVALEAQPDSLNPAKSELSSAFQAFSEIHSNLIGIDAAGNPVPRLAQRWSQLSPTAWQFDLRPNARFHNGDPVTSDEVKFSIGYFQNPKTASPWADGVAPIKAVEVDSPTRFVLHLSAPYAPLFTILGRNAQILNKNSVENGDPARHPIGAGPFQFVEWVQGDHITVKKFPGFVIAGQPRVDQVTFKFIAPTPAVVQALRSRVVNFVVELPDQIVQSVKSDSAFNSWTSPAAGLPEMLAFNLTRPPMDNKLLRQAIAWAVDRNEIHKVAFFGTGEVGSEEVGTGSYWYDGADPYKAGPNIEKAKGLISQSGVKTPLNVGFLADAAAPWHAAIGQILQQTLKPLGINLTINVQEASSWLEMLIGKKYEIAQIFNETVSDPDQQYTTYLAPHAPGNLFGWNNPQFDQARLAARQELDRAKRRQMYTDVRKFVYDDVPVFYNHYDTDLYLSNSNVVGAQVVPTGYLGLETVGFSSKQA